MQTRELRRYARMDFGHVAVCWRGRFVTRVELRPTGRGRSDRALAGKLAKVLRGAVIPAELRVDPAGLSDFARRVLGICAGIRPGGLMTYKELARRAGTPGAARAVGRVLAANPFPLLIPCHRVVGSSGALTGFGGGLAMKNRLLEGEGWRIRRRRVVGPLDRPLAGRTHPGHRCGAA
jgi:methylated-DNA-[protein]-cysteine S-methyltransferase